MPVNVYPATVNVQQSNAANLKAQVQGATADDAAYGAANPLETGLYARSTNRTAVTDGDKVAMVGDLKGRAVVVAQSPRELVTDNTTTITASTTETTVLTQIASTFLDLTVVMVANTSGTATRVDFRDTTGGTVRFSIYVPAGDTRGLVFQVPRAQGAVNTNWTAQSSASVTDLRIYVQAVKNT